MAVRGFNSSAPANGQLALRFSGSAQMQMCQANGRPQQIQDLLKNHFQSPVTLKFELVAQAATDNSPKKSNHLNSEARKELINHPAVKTILMELDATVADISEQ